MDENNDSLVDPEALVLNLRLQRHAVQRVVVLVHTLQVRLGAATHDGKQSSVVGSETLARIADVSAIHLHTRVIGRVVAGGWRGKVSLALEV